MGPDLGCVDSTPPQWSKHEMNIDAGMAIGHVFLLCAVLPDSCL